MPNADFVAPQNYYRVSVKALVFDDQRRVLVFKDHAGEWEVPGGGLDHGENYEEGIRRELREEVGAEAAQIGAELFSYPCTTQSGRPKICIVLPVWLSAQELTTSDEVAEARFVTREEFVQLPFQNGEGEITDYADKIWPDSRYPSPFARVTLKARVFDAERRLLVVQAPNGLWELPGGGWEHDEPLLNDSLTREFDEELGVTDITIGSPVFVYRAKSIRPFYVLRIVYDVILHDTNFTFGKDSIAAKFVTKKELLQLPMAADEAPIKDCVDQIWPQ